MMKKTMASRRAVGETAREKRCLKVFIGPLSRRSFAPLSSQLSSRSLLITIILAASVLPFLPSLLQCLESRKAWRENNERKQEKMSQHRKKEMREEEGE